MVPYEVSFCDYLKELVEEGEVSMERIDDAVARVLRLKYRLGLFDNPYWDIKKYDKFGSKEFAAVALQAAEESEVLLKNDAHTLPIAKGKKILLTGPNANSMRCLNGGWSYSWQGHVADEYAQAYHTIYEALCEKYGKENIIYEPGVTYAPYKNDNWWEENKPEIEKPVAAAAQADIIIACIGENSYCETPGNLNGSYLIGKPAQSGKSSGRYGQTYRFGSESGTPAYYQRYRTFGKSCCQHHAAKQLWWRRTCKLIGRRRQLQWKDAIHLSTTYQRFGNL